MGRRSIAAVLLAALVAACQQAQRSEPPRGEPAYILTGQAQGVPEGSCYTFQSRGLLKVDATFGTVVVNELAGPPPVPVPVMWRRGFTGWRIGDEIEVRDRDGNVVATTGHRYVIAGGFTDVAGTRVFFSCGGLDEQ